MLDLHVDEYGPELQYIEGPHNVIADTFSRLSHNDVSSPLVGKKAVNVVSNSESDNKHDSSYSSLLDDRTIIDCLLNLLCISSNKRRRKRDVNHSKTSNSSIEHCYLNLPEDMVEDNPLDLENIKEKQDEDDKLTQSSVKHPNWYSRKTINDVEDILCYTKPGDNAANWRIALPENLIVPTIKWYHRVTGHPGSKRL